MPRKKITDRPEERANNRVGSRNKFVDRRVHELVEKLPKDIYLFAVVCSLLMTFCDPFPGH